MLTTTDGQNTLDDRTTDSLEQELLHLESFISKARARQVGLLAEADRRQIPSLDGTRSLKEWIAGRLDMQPRHAADLAVLAKSDHDTIVHQLSSGEMTLDRAAETTRLANTGADATTIARSLGISVGQIGQLSARQRRMTEVDEAEAFAMRRVWFQPSLGNTVAVGSVTLAGADVDAFLDALDRRADEIIDPADPQRPRLEQRRVDALVSLALDGNDGGPASQGLGQRRLNAHIFVDADRASQTDGEAGATTRSGVKIGPNTLQEILCTGETQTTFVDAGQLKAVTTNGDRLPRRTREYVFYRDGGCTADGCTSRYRLEPHHIHERSRGGSDDPENLTLLCWFHHHVVVHQRGFRIDSHSPPGRRRFIAPDGVRGSPGG